MLKIKAYAVNSTKSICLYSFLLGAGLGSLYASTQDYGGSSKASIYLTPSRYGETSLDELSVADLYEIETFITSPKIASEIAIKLNDKNLEQSLLTRDLGGKGNLSIKKPPAYRMVEIRSRGRDKKQAEEISSIASKYLVEFWNKQAMATNEIFYNNKIDEELHALKAKPGIEESNWTKYLSIKSNKSNRNLHPTYINGIFSTDESFLISILIAAAIGGGATVFIAVVCLVVFTLFKSEQ